MAKEKVNYQEVYDLYQLCSETKDLREFCADYGVNYDKFMQSIILERCEGEIVKLLSINSITACFLVTYDGRQD